MKIYGKQLPGALQKQLAALYIVSGDEFLLVQEACAAIQQTARQHCYTEQQRYDITANFDWDALLSQINTLSLFSQRRFIELRLENTKLPDAGSKALQALAAHLPPDTVLLLKTPKLPAATQNSAWYKALEKHGVCVAIWPLNPAELRAWIKQRLQAAQLQTSAEGIELIAAASEGNLLAAKQTIEKLQLLYTHGNLTIEELLNTLHDNSRFTVFDLTEALLIGKAQQALKILQSLKAENTEPVLILWGITKELRQLYQLHFEQKQQPLDALLQKYRIREAQKAIFKKYLQQLQPANINLYLHQAARIDQLIKGVAKGNVWDELKLLCLQMTNTPTVLSRGHYE